MPKLVGLRQSSMVRKVRQSLRDQSVAIPTAPVQLRSKVIGNPIPTPQTTFRARSGVAKVASQ